MPDPVMGGEPYRHICALGEITGEGDRATDAPGDTIPTDAVE